MAQALTRLRPAAHAPRAAASTTLVVENMHCGGCMRKVEAALARVPGVASARANLTARRVVVTLRAGRDNALDLIEALEREGFKAAELPEEPGTPGGSAESALLRRVGVAGFAATNIMLLSVSVWSGSAGDMDVSVESLFHWLSALIALPAIAYAGQPFFGSALRAIRSRRLNMDVPISVGVSLTAAMSLYQTMRGTEQVYFDAAVALLFFLLLGRFFDQRARSKVAGAASNLLSLRATSATVLDATGGTERLAARALREGMHILVAAGERVAADGRVVEGSSEVDASLISGESRPQTVRVGDGVFAGMINLGAPLVIEATATDQHTLLAEIARLLTTGQQGRGVYVRLADRAARLYAPVVHLLGLITALGWIAAGQGWEEALTAGIAVLIITCPCALALAVPAAQVAAMGRLFASGVLVKAADALERFAEGDTVVFDKTGTLSLGEPRLSDAGALEESVLRHAASLALASRHPYARAVVAAARQRGLEPVARPGAVETPGAGLSRRTRDGVERLGSASWCGIETSAGEGQTIWYRPAHGAAVAFRFEDRMRVDAPHVVKRLRAAGYAVELLSGDGPGAVAAAAADAGILRFAARLDPAGKIARLEALKRAGKKVIMVGDGLNDAPALAAAHASMSPSTAADISQTTADAVFQGERLAAVVETIALAKASRRLALESFAIAAAYNLICVPLAAAGLITPLIAAIAMSTSSLLVTANALRLTRLRVEL